MKEKSEIELELELEKDSIINIEKDKNIFDNNMQNSACFGITNTNRNINNNYDNIKSEKEKENLDSYFYTPEIRFSNVGLNMYKNNNEENSNFNKNKPLTLSNLPTDLLSKDTELIEELLYDTSKNINIG